MTFYRNVGNQGLQFSSVGGWVYSQAVKAGKGRDYSDRMVPAGYSRLMSRGMLPMFVWRRLGFLGLAALALAMSGSGLALGQPAPEFFKGKTISLLIGFGAGGEDDLWARTIARHLGNYIPGNPVIVPQNMPGSGGLLVADRLYNTAPKDGTVLGLINRGIPFEPLLGGQGTQFDALKFNWLGSPGRDTTVCAARKDAAVKTPQDLYSKELTVGGTGSGADTAVYPRFLAALLGMKFRLVMGYQGSHEVQLAMERNEVQGICLAYDFTRAGYACAHSADQRPASSLARTRSAPCGHSLRS